MRIPAILMPGLAALFLCTAVAQKKLTQKDLPAPVQRTVTEQLKGPEIRGISKEREKGITQFEVETMLNGKHRDFNVAENGSLLVVEEETSIDGIPPAARAAILQKSRSGKLGMVEVMTEGAMTRYEAAYTSKDGKNTKCL